MRLTNAQLRYPLGYHHGSVGPVRGKTVTATQADAMMKKVMRKFAAYSDYDSDGKPLGWDGTGYPGDCPTLIWGWASAADGTYHPAIVWEGNAPDDWAYKMWDADVPGVYSEPYYSCVLVLYPDR